MRRKFDPWDGGRVAAGQPIPTMVKNPQVKSPLLFYHSCRYSKSFGPSTFFQRLVRMDVHILKKGLPFALLLEIHLDLNSEDP